jgi:hypothetical protein
MDMETAPGVHDLRSSGEGPGKSAASDREPMLYCPVCSLRLAERKCKLFCERCGYYMSCADYY